MTPEQRTQLENMQRKINAIERAEDIQFIQSIARRLEQSISTIVDQKISQTALNDLIDVDTSGVTNGQVIKYSSGTWENANDNTA